MCYNNKEWRRIRKEIDLAVQNWHDEFNKFWHEHLKEQKLYTLMGWFWRKYAMFEIQKYKGVVFYDTREWCKIWRKNKMWFRKKHEEFSKFSPEHLKVSKLGLSWGTFI